MKIGVIPADIRECRASTLDVQMVWPDGYLYTSTAQIYSSVILNGGQSMNKAY